MSLFSVANAKTSTSSTDRVVVVLDFSLESQYNATS